MDWTQILEIFGVIGGVATILTFFIGPTLWLSSKIDTKIEVLRNEMAADRRDILQLTRSIQQETREYQKETREYQKSIQQETKDFHGRLERQDAEFKARLCAIEERTN